MSPVPDELLDEIRQIWVSDPTAAFRLADAARRLFPGDPVLLCAWGDLNQLRDEEGVDLEESFAAYRLAAELDPRNGEAFESMGYYLDVFRDDPVAAEPFFRTAIELDAGRDSVIGLARVLAERDRIDEAVRVIDESRFAADSKMKNVREEIVQGVWSGPTEGPTVIRARI